MKTKIDFYKTNKTYKSYFPFIILPYWIFEAFESNKCHRLVRARKKTKQYKNFDYT